MSAEALRETEGAWRAAAAGGIQEKLAWVCRLERYGLAHAGATAALRAAVTVVSPEAIEASVTIFRGGPFKVPTPEYATVMDAVEWCETRAQLLRGLPAARSAPELLATLVSRCVVLGRRGLKGGRPSRWDMTPQAALALLRTGEVKEALWPLWAEALGVQLAAEFGGPEVEPASAAAFLRRHAPAVGTLATAHIGSDRRGGVVCWVNPAGTRLAVVWVAERLLGQDAADPHNDPGARVLAQRFLASPEERKRMGTAYSLRRDGCWREVRASGRSASRGSGLTLGKAEYYHDPHF